MNCARYVVSVAAVALVVTSSAFSQQHTRHLTVSSTSLSFGTVTLNSVSTQTLKLTSTGTGSITVEGLTVAGTGFTLKAPSVPIQVIGGSGSSAVPSTCSSTGPPENTLATLGANGVLGLGLFRQDCGAACALSGASNPGVYFVCPAAAACQPTAEPVNLQLQNPVWLFPTDNNGVVIQLPTIAPAGQASVNGSLLFGVGTRSNNALGSAKVSTVDPVGNFTTTLGGRAYTSSYVDSGTNAYFFLDATTTGMPVCSDYPDFYCPPAPVSFSATTLGINGTVTPLNFTISNADQRLANLALSAFVDVGGPSPGTIVWGLPFFYGRTVFTAIEGQSTPAGTGPYWAY